jgi:cytochrome c-type biogenesis protein CcmH
MRRGGAVSLGLGSLVALALAVPAAAQGSLPREVTDILGTPSPQMPPDRDGRKAAAGDFRAILGEPERAPPSAAEAERRAHSVSARLRCPVCQGVAVSDSPSGMASSMREQVRELVALGYSDEQVFQYFERSYGEFVRLDPPARGINWLLWVTPGLAVAIGAGLVWRWSRARSAAPPAAAPPVAPAPATTVDPDLEPYLEQVRRDVGVRAKAPLV